MSNLMQRAESLEKTLMLGKTEGRRRRGQHRMRWLDGIADSVAMSQALGDGEGQGSLACCSPWGCKESDMTERLNNNKCRRFTLKFLFAAERKKYVNIWIKILLAS